MAKEPDDGSRKKPRIRPIPFGEHPGPEPFNASEIVAIDDARFLFCDNNIGDGLIELRLAADGTRDGPLVRRSFEGLEPGTVDDLEGMTCVEAEGRRHLFVTPSFSLKKRK